MWRCPRPAKSKHVCLALPSSPGLSNQVNSERQLKSTQRARERERDGQRTANLKYSYPSRTTRSHCSLEAMISRHASLLIFFLLCVCMAIAEEPDEGGQRSVSPYWNLWSSDFFGWVEELRAQGAYDRINDLARTFWSHFSTADQLGYDRPDADPEA